MPLPADPSPGHAPSWHPADATFALLSRDGRALEFVTAVDMSSRSLELPAAFASVLWSPSGERLALLAEDGSLWQVDYPGLQKPERLSPPMPGIRDIAWSPDGSLIAFVRGANIYVVEARR